MLEKDSRLAPIVLFVYNRPICTYRMLESLMRNELSESSRLFIYSDGYKKDASQKEVDEVKKVRRIICERKWCGKVHIVESNENKGLADSIIEGVSEIINEYGKIIVLEDDLIVSSGFLNFMNRALTLYENEKKVMHISGHSFPLFNKRNEIYFLKYISSWGWATWADRWKCLETEPEEIYGKLLDKKIKWEDFNSGYGKEFKTQLMANLLNHSNTWAVKWHSSVFLNDGFSLFPSISMVRNVGFDGSGSHYNVLNTMLSAQEIESRNEFNYIQPVFSKVAYRRLRFFYFRNIFMKKAIKKIIKKIYGRFKSIYLG